MRRFKVILVMVLLVSWGMMGVSFAQAAKITTVRILVRTGPEADYLREAAKYYNKNLTPTTGINVVIDELGRHGYLTRVITILLGKTPRYDATMMLSSYIGETASAGVVEPLDEYFANKALYPYDPEKVGFLPAAFDSVRYKGRVYAFPFFISTIWLTYRTDLIKNPERLGTWEGFLEAAKEFTKSYNPNSPTEYGTSLMAKPGEILPKEWYIYFWSRGGKFFGPNWEPQFNSPAAVEALTYYVDLFRKYRVVPPDVTTYEYPEQVAAMETGKVAFASQWDASYPSLKKALGDKMAVMEMPYKEGYKSAAFVHTWTLPINAYSTHKQEIFKFLAWLTSDPQGSVWVAKNLTLPIPTKRVFLNPEVLSRNPQWKFMYEYMRDYGHTEVAIPEWPSIHETLNTFFSLALAGEITPKEACELVNTRIKELMRRGGYYK